MSASGPPPFGSGALAASIVTSEAARELLGSAALRSSGINTLRRQSLTMLHWVRASAAYAVTSRFFDEHASAIGFAKDVATSIVPFQDVPGSARKVIDNCPRAPGYVKFLAKAPL